MANKKTAKKTKKAAAPTAAMIQPSNPEEARVAKAAEAYREKHYPGVDRQKVRYNKPGSEDVIGAFQKAYASSQNLSHLCELVGVSNITGKKWVDKVEGGGATPASTHKARGEARRTEAKTRAAEVFEGEMTLNLKKEEDGSLTVKGQPRDIKTLIDTM